MTSETNDPKDIEALQRQIAEMQANVKDTGAVAKVGGDMQGTRNVKVGGDNSGTIVSGTQIVQHYYAASNTSLTKDRIAQQVAGYLRWLRSRTESIELRGIERAGGAPVVLLPLETAYVPLRARSMPRVGEALERMYAKGRTHRNFDMDSDNTGPGKHQSDVALNQVLGLGNRLVIIEGPGSG